MLDLTSSHIIDQVEIEGITHPVTCPPQSRFGSGTSPFNGAWTNTDNRQAAARLAHLVRINRAGGAGNGAGGASACGFLDDQQCIVSGGAKCGAFRHARAAHLTQY